MHEFGIELPWSISLTITTTQQGYCLTKETGAAHKPFREAVQLKRVRNVVDHKGNIQAFHSSEHPALYGSESGGKATGQHHDIHNYFPCLVLYLARFPFLPKYFHLGCVR